MYHGVTWLSLGILQPETHLFSDRKTGQKKSGLLIFQNELDEVYGNATKFN